MHKHVIAAAANLAHCYNEYGVLVKTVVIVDNCHYGRNMQEIYKILRSVYPEVLTSISDQGFVDCNGQYYNRADSYKIAKSSGQPFNDEYTLKSRSENPELDSSCIRHFKEDVSWEDYQGEIK